MSSTSPAPFHVLAKPVGPRCNVDCDDSFWSSNRMSAELLDTYIRQILEPHRSHEVHLDWQGSEPVLMGLDFFRRAVGCVEKYRKPGQTILHTMQTNGTLLDDEWCTFFKQRRFLIGLSLDGPRDMHDSYRVSNGSAANFDQVMRCLDLLGRHGVEFNILCKIHSANADHPIEVYRFFRDVAKTKFMQFTPVVERTATEFVPLSTLGWSSRNCSDSVLSQPHRPVTERSVGAEQFGRFLVAIFDEWVHRDVGNIFVQTFDVALGSWLGQHNLCIVSPTCGNAVALEHNGDLYSCDHYVQPDTWLGNIHLAPMADLVSSEKQRAFGQNKLNSLPKYCRECDVLAACYGECPRNRFITAPDGEPGLNYLCAGYKMFFRHIDSAMKTMAGLLRKGRWADEIMQIYAAEDMKNRRTGMKAGRNDPCPCRSGKRFKHCHGRPGTEQSHGAPSTIGLPAQHSQGSSSLPKVFRSGR